MHRTDRSVALRLQCRVTSLAFLKISSLRYVVIRSITSHGRGKMLHSFKDVRDSLTIEQAEGTVARLGAHMS